MAVELRIRSGFAEQQNTSSNIYIHYHTASFIKVKTRTLSFMKDLFLLSNQVTVCSCSGVSSMKDPDITLTLIKTY